MVFFAVRLAHHYSMAMIGKMPRTFLVFLLLAASLAAQEQGKNQNQDQSSAQRKRLWVLRAAGEAVEYNPATFAAMQTVKVPAEAVASPQRFSVNRLGQMLFAAPAALPLAEGDLAAEGKAWFWDGYAATTLALGGTRSTATTGSNLAITESAPAPSLSEDGKHLYWLANQARRLQRDGVDLSTRRRGRSGRRTLPAARVKTWPHLPCPIACAPRAVARKVVLTASRGFQTMELASFFG